jgi:nucleoside-diphosphate-sugar epimerase
VPEDQLPITEETELRPASPYAGSKMTAEDYCSLYYNMFGLRTTVLRIFNGYGPRQNPDSPYAAAIPAFIKRVVAGKPPTIFGDGEQTRDFVFVGDVAKAFELAAERKEADGQVINIASGSKTSVNRLVQDICGLAGMDLEPVHEEPRPGDIRHSVASVERAKELLGWEATTPLSEGLKATMDWFKASGQ